MNIELNFSCNKPNKNGIVYTKEAIEKALDKGVSNLPIIYFDIDGSESVIGCTKDEKIVSEWDDLNGVCRIKVNGIIFFVGISYIVNEISDGVIRDFEIKSICISK